MYDAYCRAGIGYISVNVNSADHPVTGSSGAQVLIHDRSVKNVAYFPCVCKSRFPPLCVGDIEDLLLYCGFSQIYLPREHDIHDPSKLVPCVVRKIDLKLNP